MDRQAQRQGIDRIFNARSQPELVWTVEYKADLKAEKTKRAFIETVSVDARQCWGWAYTSKADTLIYYLPQKQWAFIIPFDVLRERLPQWEKSCQTGSAQNDGYKTHGLLVPLEELSSCADKIACCKKSREL
ncbi:MULTISPECIES: hypothetical protein [Trichocoleus]|uniref:Uncharacterized protein n=1 Tax=Trichocoleus desertorum GB2-A4 TaxID=2933944 RepID=A0ABV0JCX0_9CYAN|nr:hypothetical protein [Trichocoleus sp. FACHB-46]MBD1864285.1 hypothetical protein [Trichocoleus sp. FACHB-46]